MKIAIVDDEEQQRDILKSYLEKFSKENECDFDVEIFKDPKEFLSSFDNSYSLLLLDIEMPGMTGLELAKKIRETGSQVGIIFVTVMAQYAINGYEVSALDFMIKPLNYFPFSLKLAKAIRNIPKDNKLIIKHEGDTVIIKERDITYVEGSNQYIVIHVKGQEPYRVKGSLKETEKKLATTQFARCGNSFIVNLDYATKVSGNDLYIDGDIIPISRSRRKEFLERMNRHFGGI